MADESKRAEMIALLREIEWVDTSGGEYRSQCPCCDAYGPDWRDWKREEDRESAEPHKPGCRLAAFIAKETP